MQIDSTQIEEYSEYRDIIINDFRRLKIIIENYKNNENINNDIDYFIKMIDFIDLFDGLINNVIQIEENYIKIRFADADEEGNFRLYNITLDREWKKIIFDLGNKRILYHIKNSEIIEQKLTIEQYIYKVIQLETNKKLIKRR